MNFYMITFFGTLLGKTKHSMASWLVFVYSFVMYMAIFGSYNYINVPFHAQILTIQGLSLGAAAFTASLFFIRYIYQYRVKFGQRLQIKDIFQGCLLLFVSLFIMVNFGMISKKIDIQTQNITILKKDTRNNIVTYKTEKSNHIIKQRYTSEFVESKKAVLQTVKISKNSSKFDKRVLKFVGIPDDTYIYLEKRQNKGVTF